MCDEKGVGFYEGTPYHTSVFVNKEGENGWTALDWVNAETGGDR
ncbi:hypothetical protein [Enterocloster hominis (ex Hitch et al. 2024)]|nr:hypothetical protein [Lachnoclostridium pacaense]